MNIAVTDLTIFLQYNIDIEYNIFSNFFFHHEKFSEKEKANDNEILIFHERKFIVTFKIY